MLSEKELQKFGFILVDDVIVPYIITMGVRDYEKMTNAFNSIDFIDQSYNVF